jgi:opacity protein-like surface antigen
MKPRYTIPAIILCSIAVNSKAYTGNKDTYYMQMNAAIMSQDIRATYTATGAGGINDSFKKSGLGPYAQLGIGYNILDDLRFDVMVHYDQGVKTKKKASYGNASYSLKSRERSFGLLANMYYDISTNTKFMPYFMGGIGFMKNSISNSYDNGSKTESASKSLTKMAYQLGTGVNTHLGANKFYKPSKQSKRRAENSAFFSYWIEKRFLILFADFIGINTP